MKTVLCIAMLLLIPLSARACEHPAHIRTVKDMVEAMEDQARSQERQERLLKDQNKAMQREIRNRR